MLGPPWIATTKSSKPGMTGRTGQAAAIPTTAPHWLAGEVVTDDRSHGMPDLAQLRSGPARLVAAAGTQSLAQQ
jgi:hypothetical protein